MMDTLKDFIAQHRHAFDAALPDAHGWRGLSKALERLKIADHEAAYVLLNRVLLDDATVPAGVWAKIAAELDAAAHDCMENSTGDPLEDFIRCHRADFDTAIPAAGAWSGIAEQLAPDRRDDKPTRSMPLRISWQRQLLRVAASVGLLIVGIGIGMWYMRPDGGFSQDSTASLSRVSPEYAEMEQFYQRDIAVKYQKVTQVAGQQQEVITQDLQQLDQAMAELRYELEQAPPGNREQIVRAMIDNYKTKVSMLERVLEYIEPAESPQQKTEDL
jgi:hypothetical protein